MKAMIRLAALGLATGGCRDRGCEEEEEKEEKEEEEENA